MQGSGVSNVTEIFIHEDGLKQRGQTVLKLPERLRRVTTALPANALATKVTDASRDVFLLSVDGRTATDSKGRYVCTCK